MCNHGDTPSHGPSGQSRRGFLRNKAFAGAGAAVVGIGGSANRPRPQRAWHTAARSAPGTRVVVTIHRYSACFAVSAAPSPRRLSPTDRTGPRRRPATASTSGAAAQRRTWYRPAGGCAGGTFRIGTQCGASAVDRQLERPVGTVDAVDQHGQPFAARRHHHRGLTLGNVGTVPTRAPIPVIDPATPDANAFRAFAPKFIVSSSKNATPGPVPVAVHQNGRAWPRHRRNQRVGRYFRPGLGCRRVAPIAGGSLRLSPLLAELPKDHLVDEAAVGPA